ncbi:MAG: hypothetical protein R2771_09865 [Saprospiraceae bacterium]
MKIIYFLAFSIFICFSIHAQDSVFYQHESKKFYEKEYQNYTKISREFVLNTLSKYDRSPTFEEIDSFRHDFNKTLRDTLQATINQKSQCKTELIDSLIEYRLQLWNYRRGQIPDSTFLLLINSYYDIDQKGAIDFCMQNWSIHKSHIMDRVESHDIPWTHTFPYISFLFSKLTDTELLELFLLKQDPDIEKNELLSKMCFRELVYNKGKEKIEAMKQYAELFIKINDIQEYNREFLKHFDNY